MSVSLVSPRQGRYTEQQSRTHSWPRPISKHTRYHDPPSRTFKLSLCFLSLSLSLSLSLTDALCLFLSGLYSPLALSASVNKHTHFHMAFFWTAQQKKKKRTNEDIHFEVITKITKKYLVSRKMEDLLLKHSSSFF